MRQIVRIFLRTLREFFYVFRIADVRTALFWVWAIVSSTPSILKSRSLAMPFRKMWERKHITFRIFGKRIVFDGKMFGYVMEIYARKCYFSIPGFSLEKSKTVVVVGSDGGVFAILAAKFADKVYAIEASHESTEQLRANAELNRVLDKVQITWGVVGSGTGYVTSESKLKGMFWEGNPPPTISFSEFISNHHLDRIDFLKIDIEGSEFSLFSYDTSWLQKVNLLVMEIHTEFGDPQHILDKLRQYGFQVLFVDSYQKEFDSYSHFIKALETTNHRGYFFAKRSDDKKNG